MKTVQHLFADLTVLVEDLHGIAVEGQAPDVSADMHTVLATSIGAGLADAARVVATIRTALDARQ